MFLRRMSGLVKLAMAAAVGATVAGGATALAAQGGAGQGPANLGQVKLDVEAYYGDTVDAAGHHHASDTSPWAVDTRRQADQAQQYLARRLQQGVADPAIVLDIDDTSELTYGFAADSDFGYDAAKAQQAIDDGTYPAIEPTLRFANWAAQHGVKVYFVTGRPQHQGPATLKDLADQGYPAPAGAYFKPEGTAPAYLDCGLECTTVQYKSETRAHIESTGETIVVSVGDQYSDLEGGYAERGFKLPNPMYYLP